MLFPCTSVWPSVWAVPCKSEAMPCSQHAWIPLLRDKLTPELQAVPTPNMEPAKKQVNKLVYGLGVHLNLGRNSRLYQNRPAQNTTFGTASPAQSQTVSSGTGAWRKSRDCNTNPQAGNLRNIVGIEKEYVYQSLYIPKTFLQFLGVPIFLPSVQVLGCLGLGAMA